MQTLKILSQPTATRKNQLSHWLAETDAALEALRNFRAYLQAWQLHPEISIDPDLFAAIVSDLAAGLLDWLDGNPVDCPAGVRPRDIDALGNSLCTKAVSNE